MQVLHFCFVQHRPARVADGVWEEAPRLSPMVVLRNYPDEQAAIQSAIHGERERIKALNMPAAIVDKVLAREIRPIVIRGHYTDAASMFEGIQKELTPFIDEAI